MIVGVLRETAPGERRVALVPEGVRTLAKAGLEVRVEAGAGVEASFADAEYEAAGARLEDGAAVRAAAALLLAVQPPSDALIEGLRPGSATVSLLRPLDEPARAARLAARGVTAFSLELVPRITRAQAMDVLSSQATVAGYRAVVLAAERLPKMFPMLVTAAGTLAAARVFVIGAGVAGLQAIATAKRLGAVVEAYDTRPAVAEQVKSLGAKFVELALETQAAEDAGGYARAQSEDFYARQRALDGGPGGALGGGGHDRARPGPARAGPPRRGRRARHAPRLGDRRPRRPERGQLRVHRAGETVVRHGVTIVGDTNLASAIPTDASAMFSKNVVALVRHLVKDGALALDLGDEITKGTLVCHEGAVVHEAVKAKLGAGAAA